MRSLTVFVAVGLIAVFAAPPSLVLPVAAAPAAPRLSLTMGVDVGVDEDGGLRFVPDVILIARLNITLNVTFVNNYTGPSAQNHTFTIRNVDGDIEIDTGNVSPGENVSVKFHINSLTNVSVGGRFFRPEASPSGIRFFCKPHEIPEMVGEIVLAGLLREGGEKGVLLRAYWIGLIGIFATLLWIVISYFVIKSSSRRFTDHKEHVRRGFP